MQQRTPRIYKYKMSRSTVDSSPSKVTVKTAEHDTVMGALRGAQDVIEGILNATQALLTSLTYPDSSTVMGAGSSPAESEAKLLLLPTRSTEKLAKELASSAKERLTLDRTAKKALRDHKQADDARRIFMAWLAQHTTTFEWRRAATTHRGLHSRPAHHENTARTV